MEIQEIIRRWQAGIANARLRWAPACREIPSPSTWRQPKRRASFGDGLVATAEQLSRLATIGQPGPRQAVTPGQDQLEPWADQIYQWAHRRPAAADQHPGVAGSAGVSGIVSVVAPLRSEAELAAAQPDHGAHGGHRAREVAVVSVNRCKSASSLLMLIRPLRPAYWASAVPRCRRRWGW